jgi:hypothetical protein
MGYTALARFGVWDHCIHQESDWRALVFILRCPMVLSWIGFFLYLFFCLVYMFRKLARGSNAISCVTINDIKGKEDGKESGLVLPAVID